MSDSDSTYDPNENGECDIAVSISDLNVPRVRHFNNEFETAQQSELKVPFKKFEHEISDSDSDTCKKSDSNKLQASPIVSTCTASLFHTNKADIEKKSSPLPLSTPIKNETVLENPIEKRLSPFIIKEKSEYSSNKSFISKMPCKYGKNCFRKNPSHFLEFSHPKELLKRKQDIDDNQTGIKKMKYEKVTKMENLTSCINGEPYSFFLTKVSGIKAHYNSNALSLQDILHPSMGKLVKSAQFNYMFEIDWVMKQYPMEFRKCPLLMVHGFTHGNKAALDVEASAYDNIKLCQAKLEIMYGTHHSKMMLLEYTDGMRVVISTANLIHNDWHQKTQGIWVSPKFSKMAAQNSDGDSKTNFKRDLIEYLQAYKARPIDEWVNTIKSHDMSTARVHIIASVPGRHTAERKHCFGHMKLRKVLQCHGPDPKVVKSWPVVGQFSSIGSLGNNENLWLCGEFYTSLSSASGGGTSMGGNIQNLKLIFPSKENVRTSLEGYPAGGSLPYSLNTAKKQLYLNNFLHQWKSSVYGRSRATPHIKTYCRCSPNCDQMCWFLVTSANLSKAAWGALEKKASQLMIRSYEIGVLFLPSNYDENSSSFCIGKSEEKNVESASSSSSSNILPYFPVPFDIPLAPYAKTDKPWLVDVAYTDLPDTHGNAWCPQ